MPRTNYKRTTAAASQHHAPLPTGITRYVIDRLLILVLVATHLTESVKVGFWITYVLIVSLLLITATALLYLIVMSLMWYLL